MKLTITSFLILMASLAGSSQDMFHLFVDSDILSVTQGQLQRAVTIGDIHERYPSDWVASYISTQITVSDGGKTSVAEGESGTLTKEQKELINNAAVGSLVTLAVEYMPSNSLANNSPKQMQYILDVIPAVFAEFQGGEEIRDLYIDNIIFSNLDSTERAKLDLAKIKFAIDEDGSVVDVLIDQSSGDEELDTMLAESFQTMPPWNPAEDADGNPVKQPINFYISNSFENCKVLGLVR